MTEPRLHIALVQPEIGPNTGSIGRLCLAVGARLHLVHPLGFQTDDKAVRRAGLDYWKFVDVVEHDSLDAFEAWGRGRRLLLFTARSPRCYTALEFEPGDVLVFGCESVGLPPELVERFGGWGIPMTGATRSLNVANAAAVVTYQALQSVDPGLFEGTHRE